MKLVIQVLLGPFLALIVLLGVIDRVCGSNRHRRVATHWEWLEAIRQGMMFGVLWAAVVSLAVILFSDPLGVPERVLPLVAALPLVGGYFGAALGFHLGGNQPGETDEA